jgi:carboxyl-terminal processing protease
VLPDITFPDFYDAYDDIGESSLDGALPWDTVRPVEFRTYLPVQAFLPKLRELHEARAAESPDFQYMIDQIERTRQLREREMLPLNEEVVKADREQTRRIEFEAENLRRKLKGLELKEWVEEDDLYRDEVANADDSDSSSAEESVESTEIAIEEALEASASSTPVAEADVDEDAEEPEETDPLLLESGRILADFINLSGGDLSARY